MKNVREKSETKHCILKHVRMDITTVFFGKKSKAAFLKTFHSSSIEFGQVKFLIQIFPKFGAHLLLLNIACYQKKKTKIALFYSQITI